jgi:UDP-2,3-diacylglucosamine hydrolase
MHAIFIADAHLRQPEDRNYRALLSFLYEQEGKVDSLVILGDLFEFLIGYPAKDFPHYQPVFDGLLRLKAAGTKIVYCEGNHDFHLGSFFTETLAADVHPGPAVIDLDGTRTLVCHGDQINRGELSHRILRALFHGPFVKALIPVVPVRTACFIADRLGHRSTSRRAKKKRSVDTRAMLIRDYAAGWFGKGCDAVVSGHFHLPFLDVTDDGRHTLLSMGEWIDRYYFGRYLDGTFSLNSYIPSPASIPNTPK